MNTLGTEMIRRLKLFNKHNFFLSNFHLCPINYAGQTYPSVEHAFQAAKTLSPEERETIRNAPAPGQAKRIGQRVTLRANWDNIRTGIMLKLIRQKFTKGSTLAAKLLATEDQMLIEGNSWGDTFWGVCNGIGENHLGKILMQVRRELKQI